MKTPLVTLSLGIMSLGIIAAANDTASSPETLSLPQISSACVVAPAVTRTASPAQLCIAHPSEGARLQPLAETFVFGSADPSGSLSINGKSVPIHPGGGFLAMVRLSSGTNVITAELTVDSVPVTAVRTIVVAPPASPSPVTPLTLEWVKPDMDLEIQPGEEISVSAKGSPGMTANFSLGSDRDPSPLPETERGSGIYRGACIVGARDRLKDAKVKVTIKDPRTGRKISRTSEGKVSFFRGDMPTVGEVTAPNAILRSGPALSGDRAAYMLFPPPGTLLSLNGRKGNEFRVRLTRSRSAWVSENEIRLLPPGTPSPSTSAGDISVIGDERTALVRLSLGRKVPFEVSMDDAGQAIDVSFFGAVANTDWMNYVSTGAVEQVRWFQDDSETYRIRVTAGRRGWWGYDARYEGSTFVLELRSPPRILREDSPLAGLTVAVDAGHSPDSGAIGPTGLVEKDVNLTLANLLKDVLIARGASVVMVRQGNEPVELYDRPRIAWRLRADILVSMHNNALAEGENPFEKHGYGVYYFQPASMPLARSVHEAMEKRIGKTNPAGPRLRDDGLHYGSLVLVRTMQMPSILVESAYMIVPEEEALLKTDAFLTADVNAVADGIQRYVNSMAPARAPAPAKKRRSRPAVE